MNRKSFILVLLSLGLFLAGCSKDDDDAIESLPDAQALQLETCVASPQSLKYINVKTSGNQVVVDGQYITLTDYSNWYYPVADGYMFSSDTHSFFVHGNYHYMLYRNVSELEGVYITTSIMDAIKAKCTRIYSNNSGGSTGEGSGGSSYHTQPTCVGKVASYFRSKSNMGYTYEKVETLYLYEYYSTLRATPTNLGETCGTSVYSNMSVVNNGSDPYGLGCNKYIYNIAVGWWYFKW